MRYGINSKVHFVVSLFGKLPAREKKLPDKILAGGKFSHEEKIHIPLVYTAKIYFHDI